MGLARTGAAADGSAADFGGLPSTAVAADDSEVARLVGMEDVDAGVGDNHQSEGRSWFGARWQQMKDSRFGQACARNPIIKTLTYVRTTLLIVRTDQVRGNH